jgi:hypothetical protein
MIADPAFAEPLLVTSPNGGGLTLIFAGQAYILDHKNTTGFASHASLMARACPIDQDAAVIEIVGRDEPIYIELSGHNNDPHDLFFLGEQLACVNTCNNDIVLYGADGKELRRIAFPGTGDAWHLNCMSSWGNSVVVSCFGRFDTHRGYKENTLGQGFIFDLESGKSLWDGLSQPHSPLHLEDGEYVCDSETHRLLKRDFSGNMHTVQLDGYTRGLAACKGHLYVGISASREAASGSFCTAKVVALDKTTLLQVDEMTLPFKEIYGIHSLTSKLDELLMLFKWSLSERDRYLQELQLPRFQTAQLDAHRQVLHRLHHHPVVGRLIRLLARLKGDPSFCDVDGARGPAVIEKAKS